MYNTSLNTASMKRLDLQKNENGFGGFLYYSNEEELKKLINEMFLYAKNELIPRLEEDYYYKKSFNDEDLNRLLFLKHSEYYEEYKSQEDDNFSISKGLDITQLFSYVENRLDYINCLKNEKANDEIIKLAAVMGTALEIEFSGVWDLVNLNGEKKVIIKNIKSEIVCYYILDELLKVYRGEKTIEMIKFVFDYMMKTKL